MNFIAWMIVACEIAFWIVIAAGLAVRYVLRMKKLGLAILALTPVVDLVLLLITGYDLANGATATTAHALAAVYIGVSIAFGKSMIRWADERFQYYILKTGPKPVKRYGMEHAKHYMAGWLRHVLAYVIGAGLLALTIFIIDAPERTQAMLKVLGGWTLILGIDLIIAISYFIWPRRPEGSSVN